jgi:hypothetical protein
MAMDMISGRGAPPGPPPNLAALLGAGGGAPGGGPQQGATTQQGDPVAIVSNMLDLAQQYLQVEPDQDDKLAMQKVSTELQQLLAKDQADGDKAMSGDLGPRTLRKALGG